MTGTVSEAKTNAHPSLRHKQDAALGRCFAHVFDMHQPVALLQVDGGNAFHLCYVFGSLGTFDQSAAGIEEHLADRKKSSSHIARSFFVLLKFEKLRKGLSALPAAWFREYLQRAALSMHHAT